MDDSIFQDISTRGRFIYGYLCIRNAINHFGLVPLPAVLDGLFREFVSSASLDLWHEKVEDILPSWVLDSDEVVSKFFSKEIVEEIKIYYGLQPRIVVDLIDKVFWLGIANLYVAFNQEKTLKQLMTIIELMKRNSITLPHPQVIKHCSAAQRGGWGDLDDLTKYISQPSSSN